VNQPFGCDVRIVRLFWGHVKADVERSSLVRNLCAPSPIKVPRNTKQATTFVIGSRPPLIFRVNRRRGVSQVAYSVISTIAVYVIKHLAGPLSVVMKPCQSVRGVSLVIQTNRHVPVLVNASGLLALVPFVPFYLSGKNSSVWVVIKKFAQFLRGKIGISHKAVLSLIGQRPASVGSACRASLF
jgi:hypothetical protein